MPLPIRSGELQKPNHKADAFCVERESLRQNSYWQTTSLARSIYRHNEYAIFSIPPMLHRARANHGVGLVRAIDARPRATGRVIWRLQHLPIATSLTWARK